MTIFQINKLTLHIFPELESPSLASHFTSDFVGTKCLCSNELLLTESFSKKRLSHFCTGRFSAKVALKKLGIENYGILAGPDGEPIWPEGIVGSISHCNDLAGAIVTNDPKIKSIGLDIERTNRVKHKMWNMCFTIKEKEFLNHIENSELNYYTTLLFCLKESFYKAQYPITKNELWFTDIEISKMNTTFKLKVFKDNYELDTSTLQMDYRYLQSINSIVTYCSILNDSK